MSSWDHPNTVEKLGLVWRNRNKISQIINDYLYFPFFLLIYVMTIGLALFFLSRGSWLQLSMAVGLLDFPPPLSVVKQ
jgi:hypothetical protein